MTQQDWKSSDGSAARLGGPQRTIVAPHDDQGVRNALNGAFACSTDVPEDFERLLARLR